MHKLAALVLVLGVYAHAETHRMTLRQAVETALKQNPDIALSRLDEEKARQAVRQARDPFTPRLTVGSGVAATRGFPMSIEGSAPTVFRVDAAQYLFNRPQSYAVAQARENARGASLAVGSRRDEVGYRSAALYLDAERAVRVGALARKDAESLERVLDTVRAQVAEGRALPVAEKQAAYNLARGRAVAENLEDDRAAAETALAMALGFPAGDRVQPMAEERGAPPVPAGRDQALKAALEANKQLKQLESQMLAKQLQMRGERAARLPRADLVAQYGLLARFNNYEEFFQRFERHNAQIGVSLQLPVFTGPGISAQVAQTSADISRLKIEYNNLRNQIESDLDEGFRNARRAGSSAELARLDLDLARENLSVALARMQEGRAPLREVEEARVVENEKWIVFYDAQYALEKARLNLLRLTGTLEASLQ